jgi:hypothetical protein
MVEMVQDRRRAYGAGSRTLQGARLEQAALALRLGLAKQGAEEVLLPTPADLLGANGIKLELDLLLSFGRAGEVRDILGDEGLQANKERLLYYDLASPRNPDGSPLYAIPYHLPAYDWLYVVQAAAVGDYARAQEGLRAIRGGWQAGHRLLRQQQEPLERRIATSLPGLLSGPAPFLPAYTAQALVPLLGQKVALAVGEPTLRAQAADLYVLEGLLALEQGEPDTARSAFAAALELCDRPPEAAAPFAGRPVAVRYLGKLSAGK